jgi:hypothetical protein
MEGRLVERSPGWRSRELQQARPELCVVHPAHAEIVPVDFRGEVERR